MTLVLFTVSGCSADGSFKPPSDLTGSGAGAPGSGGTVDSGAGGAAGAGGAGATGGSGGGSGGLVGLDGASSGGTGVTLDDGCAADTRQAQLLPLDVYVLFDQSESMMADAGGISRWNAVKNAMLAFLNAPGSAGMGIGIQYFGIGLPFLSCGANYAQPEVPIAPLPQNAGAMAASLDAHAPVSDTPTSIALQGAITYTRQWKGQNPDHVVVVLLVTDGEPFGCGAGVENTAQIAADGAGTLPQIPTFVLGVGPSLANLNQIAAAGGSKQAYIVDGSSNVEQQVLDALNQIRGTASLPCEYQIPTSANGQPTDISQVNVSYTPAGGQPQLLYQVPGASQCNPANGGWYYDDPSAPTTIEICPSTCDAISTDTGGSVDILVGCATQVR